MVNSVTWSQSLVITSYNVAKINLGFTISIVLFEFFVICSEYSQPLLHQRIQFKYGLKKSFYGFKKSIYSTG